MLPVLLKMFVLKCLFHPIIKLVRFISNRCKNDVTLFLLFVFVIELIFNLLPNLVKYSLYIQLRIGQMCLSSPMSILNDSLCIKLNYYAVLNDRSMLTKLHYL